MILRDQLGEIEAGLGDLFSYKGCEFEIVTPDSEASQFFGFPVICVRLRKGDFAQVDGEIRKIEAGQPAPLLFFDYPLVATCIRSGRPAETARPEQHPPEFEALAPYQEPSKETKASRAKNSKPRPEEDQPTLW